MRRILDAFIVALESLAEHKLRTTLTMLGMMFGVGAVIAMLSIGAGAERQALSLIDRLGTRNVVVRSKTFKPEELAEIRNEKEWTPDQTQQWHPARNEAGSVHQITEDQPVANGDDEAGTEQEGPILERRERNGEVGGVRRVLAQAHEP